MIDRLRTALHPYALVTLVALACSACTEEEAQLLDQAKAEHAAGKLDEALVSLEVLKTRSPGTTQATEAGPLGASWLVSAAAQSSDTIEKQTRLERALEWHPESGPAQLGLCQILVKKKLLKEAGSCLDKELSGKVGTDPAALAEVRAELKKAELAATKKERLALLAGGRPHQYQALLDRFPGTPEAAKAKRALELYQSLCSDRARFLGPLEVERKRQLKSAPTKIAAAFAHKTAADQSQALQTIGRDSQKPGRLLKELALSLDVHPMKPGETKAKDPLRQALFTLSDRAHDLAEGLKKNGIENVDSYVAGAKRLCGGFLAANKTIEKQLTKQLTTFDQVCGAAASDGDAGAADAGKSGDGG